MRDLNFLNPGGTRNSLVHRRSSSPKSTIGVFVVAFLVLISIFNAPAIISALTYRLSHSEESDNERLTQEYRALYGSQVARGEPVSSFVPVPTLKPFQSVYPSKPISISISKIGISSPIVRVSSADDTTILKALKNGVVLYPGSAEPGTEGTTIIVGHSSSPPPWTKYSAIFSRLEKISKDDVIHISSGGQQLSYRVTSIEHGSVEQLLNAGLGGDLILSSCWPTGTDKGRIVVVADLVR